MMSRSLSSLLVCVAFAGVVGGCATGALDNELSPKKEAELVNSLAVRMDSKVLRQCHGALYAFNLVREKDFSSSVARMKSASERREAWGAEAPLAKYTSIEGEAVTDIAANCLSIQNHLQFTGAVKE